MCRQQYNQVFERKKKKIEDYVTDSLVYTIDQNHNVILSSCSLCDVYKPKAFIFVCGCRYIGLLCEHCLLNSV